MHWTSHPSFDLLKPSKISNLLLVQPLKLPMTYCVGVNLVSWDNLSFFTFFTSVTVPFPFKGFIYFGCAYAVGNFPLLSIHIPHISFQLVHENGFSYDLMDEGLPSLSVFLLEQHPWGMSQRHQAYSITDNIKYISQKACIKAKVPLQLLPLSFSFKDFFRFHMQKTPISVAVGVWPI